MPVVALAEAATPVAATPSKEAVAHGGVASPAAVANTVSFIPLPRQGVNWDGSAHPLPDFRVWERVAVRPLPSGINPPVLFCTITDLAANSTATPIRP